MGGTLCESINSRKPKKIETHARQDHWSTIAITTTIKEAKGGCVYKSL